MDNNNHKEKQPLFHITKRNEMPVWQAMSVRVIAVMAALLLCMILSFILIGINPGKMLVSMITGSFGSQRRVWKFFKDLAVLLCISLAVTPAFRMKFWNIGAEGQTLIGCLASVACIINLGGKVSEPLLVIIMLAASLAAGAIWGLIPAIFKAIWDTNETLFTLMMNYIATFIVSYYLMVWTPSGSSTLGALKYGFLPVVFHNYFLLILVVVILTVLIYVYLNYSKHGYEISVVGESRRTALYIGINVKKVIVRTMALSGALCGLAGFLIVSALDHSITTNSVGGQGFTAIMVSWLAKFNPLAMAGTSALITFLNQGASQISTDFNIDSAFPNIIVGIIIFFIIGCEFFIYYKVNFRHKGKEAK
ncbi:MAG: ABC transporter permease [Lachnospiraceae bacterium]|nr:ABC transporter permease [Lachnospiraceae bacterium]